MKEEVVKILFNLLKKEGVKVEKEEIEKYIGNPPSAELGDFAFPCFFLAERMKIPPEEISLNLRGKIKKIPSGFEDIQTKGPYINFFLDRKNIASKLIEEIKFLEERYGRIKQSGVRTMVEFPSPNTNKPLHLGHLRNITIGESISRISEFNGEKVIRANLNNDRGIHICKSMAAYDKYGKNKKPAKKQKSDHFVGDFYVMFNEKSKTDLEMERESHRMLQQWEAGDKKTLALWSKMNKWALDGFKKTYSRFGISHDVEYFESAIYKKGKEIVEKGLKEGIFYKKKDGAIAVDLKKEGLGEKVLIRLDGTSIYITQDLYLAELKYSRHKIGKSIYVVGNEQNYHFNVLFSILKKLGFNTNGLKHLSYGLVNLPEGRMKSREGTVVDADDLIDEVQKLVKEELKSRGKIPKAQLEKNSLKIALAAIKYILLKVDTKKDMIFNPKESIDFEGDTGSYILYSYARASSILRKFKRPQGKVEYFINDMEPQETALVKKLSEFKEVVLKSFENLNPSILANYAYNLAKIFNEFYHACPVINSRKKWFRADLVVCFKQVLGNSLDLLGIEYLEKM